MSTRLQIFPADMTQQQYRAIHDWVQHRLGKPSRCDTCGTGDESVRYEWSNISGNYLRDLSDWQRLCKPCHARYDNRRLGRGNLFREYCKNGHKLVLTNLVIIRHVLLCRRCKNDANNAWRHSKEAAAA